MDKDFDVFEDDIEENEFLLYTDYANMQMYFFTNEIIIKINNQCLKKKKINQHIINQFIIPILIDLFKIRYVNSYNFWGLKKYDFVSLLVYKKGRFSFNVNTYFSRYLNKNGRIKDLDKFKEDVSKIVVREDIDVRNYIHGHDFLSLLGFVLKSLLNNKAYADNSIVFNLLKVSSSYIDLEKEGLFNFIASNMK